ncbi:MAG TPA: AmmeMemoRadiSam system radical SAM enzyme [Candidatus Paceibacterota bacterium]|nr:AmmeMemoRadiSam system radical SAM enzyme [Candidatus Paceibacterota bacterium]
MMTKATLYEKLRNKEVKCLACNHGCLIPEGKTGICGVRKNLRGELDLMVYNKPIAVNIDPIEKKPLFHFYPGQGAFSLGTIGCNFGCEFCQNWDISQLSKTPEADISKILEETQEWPAKKIIDYCLSNNLKIIAYTYNEPTIWAEYALETMKLAKKNGIKNVWVSNGFFTDKTLKEISPYLDAVNIDLKSFSEKFYNKICKAKLEPVKNNIKQIYDFGIWEEITTLIIPTLNDSEKELSQIAKFLFSISKDLVWHISAFYPAYKMINLQPTPQETLIKAYQIGKKAGLNYVYTGNIPDENYESTYCPKCGEKLIERWGIEMIQNKLKDGKCFKCGVKIPGRWQ